MVKFVFSKAYNLPNMEVCYLEDIVKPISHLFEMGYKYFFTCEPKGQYIDPATGEKYLYTIRCRYFPTKGGRVTESIIGYSNRPIPIKNTLLHQREQRRPSRKHV